MVALKFLTHLLSWAVIVLVLLRGFPERRKLVTAVGTAAFAAGTIGAFFLFSSLSANVSFGIIKTALGVSFLLLWGVSMVAIYRSTGRGLPILSQDRFSTYPAFIALSVTLAGIVAGAICASRLQGVNGTAVHLLLLVLTGAALAFGAGLLEKLLPATLRIAPTGIMAAVVALLLFSSSSILRLDLFSPLSMKVMKGVHDFVHQFMESVLVPDHLFVRSVVWKYIGLLFGKGVGFWGGMIIWFTPAILIALAIYFRKLPSVAHIRQGALRRKLLAAAIGMRRSLLVAPLFSVAIFAAAAYQSSFPSVEYWDPKPLPVSASPTGEIFIAKKGEIDLEDGKLHKYLFKQGDREARFFVLRGPGGKFTVDLDACAICKPNGYGQAEGAVICYYCVTLIPLETVGKPGGCNPVPIPFTEKTDGIVVDGMTLINSWTSTVKTTTGGQESGK